MLRVFGCITQAHDFRLVLLAGLICLLACYSALNLVARAGAGGAARWAWGAAAALIFGAGVWSTHFVAMLAFQPGLPVGYDVTLTASSVALAVAISGLGLIVALRRRGSALVGGAVVGVAIGAMHYTGMAALRVAADPRWDSGFVAASLLVGTVLGAAALRIALGAPGLRRRLLGALVLTLAICGLHFTAMAAVTLDPNPLVALPEEVMAPQWLAVAIAAVTVLIIALGLIGSMLDRHLAERSLSEAQRLRAHIAELETTKAALEATTRDLAAALDAAAAGSQAKSQFLATMSHELRTPLNAIIGFSEMLARQSLGPLGDARYIEYARNIQESGIHLLNLINDVLDFSKTDAGRLELLEDEIAIDEVVRGALRMVRSQANEARVVLYEEVDASLPLLRADQRRVLQVFLNLLSNAVKFTPAGGKVGVIARRRGAGLAVEIRDTGIGIAAEDIPRAFERFGQIDNGLSRRYEGTGLGLPLSKRLMEVHGGTLELVSTLGLGTSVTITFPASRIVELASA